MEAALQAAAELSDEIGFERISIAAIAQRLGVKAPSMYNYFDGLDSLRRQLQIMGLDELTSRLTEASIGRSEFELLHAVATAQKDMAAERPGLYSASVAANIPGDDELNAHWLSPVKIFQAVVRSYGIEGDEASHALRILRTSIHGFALVNSIDGFRLGASPEDTFERLVMSIHNSLANWGEVSAAASEE